MLGPAVYLAKALQVDISSSANSKSSCVKADPVLMLCT